MRVELDEYAGSDESHALSAWTSTRRELDEDRRARLPAMLARLASDGHETPFEKSYLHFIVEADTASHIHLLKHRIGVSVNGESARYKELKEDKFHIPEDWDEAAANLLENHVRLSQELYHYTIRYLTDGGMDRKRAKESARFFLPYANVLTLDVSFNFRSFMHFQKLRNDEHAQKEIRDIAEEMLRQVRETGRYTYSLKAFGY